MRVLILMFLVACAFAKINMKALTESMGQEVIEIGAPIKELPPDIEEEPSAENEGEKTSVVATPKDKVLKKSDPTKKTKDVDKIDGKKQEDEEERIEKELADIYKDSIDYKSDEVTREDNITEVDEKPIARVRTNFQFQPDSNNPEDVARFRTSVDDIICDRTKLSGVKPGNTNGKTRDKEIITSFEKELAKDKESIDDESEKSNDLAENATDVTEYNIARTKNNKKATARRGYWFGPEATDKESLDRYRTSQDYLNCDMLKLAGVTTLPTSGAQELFKYTTFWVMIWLIIFN